MILGFGIALCFLPLAATLIICKVYFKLKITHQLIAILLGLVAVLPISFIQYYLPDIPGITFVSPILYSLLKSLLLYGLVEEALKMVLLFPLPHKNYDTLHFLLLTFIAGLSLGCFESVVYFFDHLQIANGRGAQLLYGQIAARIFSADIIHMTCTGLCGLFVYTVRDKELKAKTGFFITAVLIHGIYDFFAGFSSSLKWFSILVVLLAIAECRIKYSSLQNTDNQ